MKKYNIKIKNLFFLSFFIVVLCLPAGKVWAIGIDICSGSDGSMGVCQSMWCSGTWVKDEKGSIECAEANYVKNICCVEPKKNISTTPISSVQSVSGRICKSSDGSGKVGHCVDGSADGVIPECSAETIPSNDCSKDMFVVCCGDSNGTTPKPSLIKCNGGAGLCYGTATCPAGLDNLGDKYSICGNGKYTACCGATAGADCGTGGSCVDEGVLCTDTISVTTCGAGKKCCSIKVPQTASTTNDPVTVKASSPVPYGSQCDSNNKNCKTDNERAILANQCQNLFTAAECTSMPIYLSSLTNKCLQMKPTGIDCAMINSGGFYGNEASKFASYYIQNSASGGANGTGVEAGGLDFASIAATGIPDSPSVKVVLVNIVKWMLEILGLLTFIAFIISGGQYLLASGDDKMIETAKKNMTYSIIGIIVALSGFVIIRAIDTALRATSTLF